MREMRERGGGHSVRVASPQGEARGKKKEERQGEGRGENLLFSVRFRVPVSPRQSVSFFAFPRLPTLHIQKFYLATTPNLVEKL